MAFQLDDLADLLSNQLAVALAQVPVIVFIRDMDDELRALWVSAESHSIHFEQIYLSIDLYNQNEVISSPYSALIR